MRIYLCGQKYFGREVLRLLQDRGHEVRGVSAPSSTISGQPDRLWEEARLSGLPLLEAGRLTAQTLPKEVDLIVAAHSHDFISRRTRLSTTYGAIGYHPSLLPMHRGRDAVRWAVRLGERVTGGTVYWLSNTVDGGPIAAQDWCWILPGESAEDLWRRELSPMGLHLLRQVLNDVSRRVLVRIPQDPRLATWEPALNPPPLHRPDLLMLGAGNHDSSMQVLTSRDAVRAVDSVQGLESLQEQVPPHEDVRIV